MVNLNMVAGELMNRGFLSKVCANREDAIAQILEEIGLASVGFGGSVTLNVLKLYETLEKRGNKLFWHWKDGDPARFPAMHADIYLSSANALLTDGRIVNIDGFGNRVSALGCGPKKAILVIGRNKIVEGGLDDGIRRIKEKACAPNALRLGLSTPCALTGKCNDCRSAQRMCSVISVIEKPPGAIPDYTVYLIDEDLGF